MGVSLAGCLGEVTDVSTVGAPAITFASQITLTPDAPTAGRHVSVSLSLTSHCETSLDTDVDIRVIHASGRVLFEQTWSALLFHPEEVWDLTQGFLPATDDRGQATIWVTLTDHASGKVLWEDHSATLTLQ